MCYTPLPLPHSFTDTRSLMLWNNPLTGQFLLYCKLPRMPQRQRQMSMRLSGDREPREFDTVGAAWPPHQLPYWYYRLLFFVCFCPILGTISPKPGSGLSVRVVGMFEQGNSVNVCIPPREYRGCPYIYTGI